MNALGELSKHDAQVVSSEAASSLPPRRFWPFFRRTHLIYYSMARRRFLIVRIVALGDIAVTSVLVSRIRAEHPDAHVTWMTGESGAPVVGLFPGVDEVIVVSERALLRGGLLRRIWAVANVWRQLVGRRFQEVFVVHADWRYRLLVLPLLPFARVAMLRHGSNPLLSRFRGDEYARLLDHDHSVGPIPRSYPFADVRPSLSSLPRFARRAAPRVALAPGGARNLLRDDGLRRWPVENYRQLAERLTAAGYDVVLLGDGVDAALRPHFTHLDTTDLMGQLSLVELLGVLRDVDVLVTQDTGPLHFARLVRTPAVAIFGPTEPRHMVGETPDIIALWGGAGLPCRPCYDGVGYAKCSNNLCMKDVTPDRVIAAVESILARGRPPVVTA